MAEAGRTATARCSAPLAQEVTAESISQRMARLAEAVGREPKNPIALEDMRSGLEAFCRGAGIAPESLPAEAQGRLLHLAGRLFREAFVGFKDLERTRADTRNRYRIETPAPDSDDPRPSLAQLSVEDLMIALFLKHEGRRLDSVQWLRETLAEAKLHEQATAQATRAPPSSNFSTASIRLNWRRVSSARHGAARHAPPTRRSTGSCLRPSTET